MSVQQHLKAVRSYLKQRPPNQLMAVERLADAVDALAHDQARPPADMWTRTDGPSAGTPLRSVDIPAIALGIRTPGATDDMGLVTRCKHCRFAICERWIAPPGMEPAKHWAHFTTTAYFSGDPNVFPHGYHEPEPGWDDETELPHRRPVWPNAVGGLE